MVLIVIYSFIGLANVCDDYLAVSLETLCVRWNVREDVAGATFMAFGSAAPEIIINAVTTIKAGVGNPKSISLGVGAIIGSGLIAFLIIPAACALSAPESLSIKRRPLLRDVCAYSTALVLLCLFFADGEIKTHEAFTLVIFYAFYVLVVALSPSIRQFYRVKIVGKKIRKKESFVIQRLKKEEQEKLQKLVSGNLEIADNSQRMSQSLLGEEQSVIFEDEEEEDEEEEAGPIGQFVDLIATPMNKVFEWTCPKCEVNCPGEGWYGLTFMVSFVWVAFFSFVISSIVGHWSDLSTEGSSGGGAGGTFFGLVIVAIGAEVPDTIQSVTVAKRGYGSMAVANSIGSQIINICIGLGLPWLIYTLASNKVVPIDSEGNLQFAAWFQVAAVSWYFILVLGAAVVYKQNKAQLNPPKGYLLVAAYVILIAIFAGCTFSGIPKTK
jgi:Ca2+/Na+ antiporter